MTRACEPNDLACASAFCGTARRRGLSAAALTLAVMTAWPVVAAETPEPVVVRTVTEDASTRIEETRVRGALQRIVVQPKGNAASYEITPPSGAVDPSQTPSSRSGERRWRMFSF